MISDILSDAVAAVDRCLATSPAVYPPEDDLTEDIHDLLLRMRLMVARLDRSPTGGGSHLQQPGDRDRRGGDVFAVAN